MNAVGWLLTPFSVLYGGAIGIRNLYYDHVHTAVSRAGIPVISIGNLTVGGTGKTPLVIEVVRRLQALGRRPAILTRGYRSTAGEPADEVLECHAALPVVPVIVNPDRVAGAAAAQHEHNADCLVLDDGFQHRRLARDLDIVLIDALQPWGGGWLLPAGRMREPRGSLRRADVIVITRANQASPDAVAAIEAELRQRGSKLVLRADVEADALVGRDERGAPLADLAGRNVLAACGIGNPRTFEKLVAALTGVACRTVAFADHHRYSAADVAALGVAARRAGAEVVVTTRKDWVKLAPLWSDAQVSLVRLDVRLVLQGTVEEFDARLRLAVGQGAGSTVATAIE